MTHTLTDEDGRKAQYTLTPNHAGMTMTVNTEEAKESVILSLHEVVKNLVEAAYEAGRAAAVPVGLKLVPIEPTEAMLEAGLMAIDPLNGLIDWTPEKDPRGELNYTGLTRKDLSEGFVAMLSASPKAGE